MGYKLVDGVAVGSSNKREGKRIFFVYLVEGIDPNDSVIFDIYFVNWIN